MTAPVAFSPLGATVNIAATTASQSVGLPLVGNQVRVFNTAPVIAFVEFTNAAAGAVASVTTSIPVLPNSSEVFSVHPSVSSAAAILPSGTGTVYFTRGDGQ